MRTENKTISDYPFDNTTDWDRDWSGTSGIFIESAKHENKFY
jgi:hypothetical protein